MKEVMDWCVKNDHPRSSIFEERLAKANSLIDKGNELFKNDASLEAKFFYLAAAYHADFDTSQQVDLTVDHKTQVRNVLIRVLLNIANNFLKLKEFNSARLACTIGLDLAKTDKNCPPETTAKFYYRRARAMTALKLYEEAAEDAKKAMELVPNDTAVREVYIHAYSEAKRAKAESDNIWKGKHMFSDTPEEVDLPYVELILTDNNGNPIESQTNKGRASSFAVKRNDSVIDTVYQLICCKRKSKVQ